MKTLFVYQEIDESNVPESAEERREKAESISTSRILSQEDFKKIQQRQVAKQLSGEKKGSAKKRKREQEEEEERQVSCIHIIWHTSGDGSSHISRL